MSQADRRPRDEGDQDEAVDGSGQPQTAPEDDGAEPAVERYSRMVDRDGSVRVGAGELVFEFGEQDMSLQSREVVADELWEAGLTTQPPLAGADVKAATSVKVIPVDEQQVGEVVAAEAKHKARYKVSPVGAGIAALGGVLLAVATFMPLDEPGGVYRGVQSNSLIQHGEWWLLLVGAIIAIAAIRGLASNERSQAWGVIVFALIAGAVVFYLGQDKGLRTLYPVGLSGEPEEVGSGTVVPLGSAIYIAGAGTVLALIGGVLMRQTAEPIETPIEEATRRCPDCAETILAAARVCKHCGARLEPTASDATN